VCDQRGHGLAIVCNGYLIILLLLSTYRFVAYVIEQRLVALLLPCVRFRWVLEMNFGSIDRYYVYILYTWTLASVNHHKPYYARFLGDKRFRSLQSRRYWSCCYWPFIVVIVIIAKIVDDNALRPSRDYFNLLILEYNIYIFWTQTNIITQF